MRWPCVHNKKAHIEGAPEPCGKVAFYSLVPVVRGMVIRSRDFVMPDGTEIVYGAKIVCGGCGVALDMRWADSTLSVEQEQ